jgi:hypothetical protein
VTSFLERLNLSVRFGSDTMGAHFSCKMKNAIV